MSPVSVGLGRLFQWIFFPKAPEIFDPLTRTFVQVSGEATALDGSPVL